VAIVGDEDPRRWVRSTGRLATMVARLGQGQAKAALVEGVRALGDALARHFPRRPDDTNELSDHVSLG
jgi:uncharacterized membrane protein